ncbi:hypothetical protein SASPL_116202 [Salvia splendens]|uniref:DNA-directed RNA polymerase subunit n=1 Tax=Salvia splendens TaxID=180675 RepID=A0A8X8XTD3_SALSN|nr:uncharacterized protein LOC121806988 [Salvia splendens]KAG6419693.1 hypothetical protein SASPL_116202 [Salvia splendens]
MAGLEECEANLVVFLHPSKANCASDAILSELSSLLFTYNETFGGVVLAYDPSIRSNLAKIVPGTFPCFGVQLKAKLLLFNPKPDMVLEGEVVKLTPNSIHAVVLGFSSAVIADDDIRDEFKHKVKGGEEVYVSRTHRKHKIKVGAILRFTVKSFDEEILHISGSLLAPHTGGARWLDKNTDEWSRADSTATKRNTDKLLINGDTSMKNDEQIEKPKKRRRQQS